MVNWDRVEQFLLATRFSKADEKAIDDAAYVCAEDPELAARYIVWLQNSLEPEASQ